MALVTMALVAMALVAMSLVSMALVAVALVAMALVAVAGSSARYISFSYTNSQEALLPKKLAVCSIVHSYFSREEGIASSVSTAVCMPSELSLDQPNRMCLSHLHAKLQPCRLFSS